MLSPHQSLYEIFHVKDIQTMWKYVSFLLFIEYVHTYTDPFVQMKSVLTMENHGGFQQKNSIDFFVSSYNFLIRQYNLFIRVWRFFSFHRYTVQLNLIRISLLLVVVYFVANHAIRLHISTFAPVSEAWVYKSSVIVILECQWCIADFLGSSSSAQVLFANNRKHYVFLSMF